jgi:hypothetical protein
MVLVADATIPGTAGRRGKRFTMGWNNPFQTTPMTQGFEAREDLVITRISALGSTSLTTVLRFFMLVPGTPADFTMDAVGTGITNFHLGWVERPSGNADAPPVFAGANFVSSFTTGRGIMCLSPQATVQQDVIRQPFFMAGPTSGSTTGTRIQWITTAAVVSSFVQIEGYVF